jgi:hypothetical protein
MDYKTEKAMELLERAAKLGLQADFQNGVIILKMTTPAVDLAVITDLTKYLPEIRSISRGRAVAALAKRYAGSRIFSKEHGAGRLVDASEDGTLTISISSERRRSDEEEIRSSQISVNANAESLLILEERATSFEKVTEPPPPKRGISGWW